MNVLALSELKRLVIKLGSALLVDDRGDIDAAFITEEEASAELANVSGEDLDDAEMPAEIVEAADAAEAEQPEQAA